MRKNIFKTIAMVLTFMLMMSSFAFAADTKTETTKTETTTETTTETKTEATVVTPAAINGGVATPAAIDGAVNSKVPADVQGKPYEAAVAALIEKGIIKGYADGTFKPENNLTRAEACVIVVKTMTEPTAEIAGTATQKPEKSGFADMGAHGWADPYVAYAVKMGVVTGYEDKTFRPAKQVSCDEFMAMIVNAAGYKEKAAESGAWPTNYQSVGTELNFYKELSEISKLPKYAPRWIAAQMDFNAMEAIEKKSQEKPEEKPEVKPEGVPSTIGMTFSAAGSFDSNITTYGGYSLDKNITVNTYGLKKDFVKAMDFSEKAEDYKLETVFKYKSATTPAFYKVEGGKITQMILPNDVGFSGRVYGVIQSASSVVDGKGDAVTALNTLSAGKEITWLCEKGVAPLSADNNLDGICFELYAKDGVITNIAKATDSSKKSTVFAELTTEDNWDTISTVSEGTVTLTSGRVISIVDNATVYTLDSSGKSYRSSGTSSLRVGKNVRIYDISEDNGISGDIIIVK